MNGTDVLIRLGRYDEAEALVAQMGERGFSACVAGPLIAAAPIALRRGRFEEAAQHLAAIDEASSARSDVQIRGSFHMLAAELALNQDRPDDAYSEVEQALGLAAGTDDEMFRPEMSALALQALGDRLAAARDARRPSDLDKARLLANGHLDEVEHLVDGPAERGAEPTLRTLAFVATCAAERSRLDASDPDLWAEAAGRWEAAREPHREAYCRWREAEALLAGRGGRSRAAAALETAWRSSRRMGARPLAERVERLAVRARIVLGDGDDDSGDGRRGLASDLGLTPREVEVLGQLAAGRTDREIADALFISKKTASVHISNVLRSSRPPTATKPAGSAEHAGLADDRGAMSSVSPRATIWALTRSPTRN